MLVGEAANVAREAGRQLGHFSREQVMPGVKASYGKYAAPYVDKSKQFSKQVLSDKVVPDRRCRRRFRAVRVGCRERHALAACRRQGIRPARRRHLRQEGRQVRRTGVEEARRQAGRARPAEAGHRRRRRDRDHPRRRRRRRRRCTPRGRRCAPTTSSGLPTTRCARPTLEPARINASEARVDA